MGGVYVRARGTGEGGGEVRLKRSFVMFGEVRLRWWTPEYKAFYNSSPFGRHMDHRFNVGLFAITWVTPLPQTFP